MSTPIPWDTVKDAIQKWVREAAGIPGARVIWPDEGGGRPDLPFVELSIDGIRGIGRAWKVRDDNPAPTSGNELRERRRQHKVATLEIQLFTAPKSKQLATELLEQVMSALEEYVNDLDDAGVGIGDESAVQHIQGSRNGLIEPRAHATVVLHLGAQVESYLTYIERMQITANVQNGDVVIPTVTKWTPYAESFSAGFSAGFEGA